VRVVKSALAAVAALALWGCGAGRPLCPEGAMCGDAGATPGAFVDAAARANRWVPYIDGAFGRVFRPDGTRYVNDHTLLRDGAGRWHLFGITDDSQGDPGGEESFLHATASELGGPWVERGDVLDLPRGSTKVRWAPHVIEPEPMHWVMYFWGGTPDDRVQRADSTDLFTWTLDPRSAPGGRDPFVLRVGQEWLLYSVGVSELVGEGGFGQIVVSRSTDLERWSEPTVALQDPALSFGWGSLESPTVVARDDGYYLFVTRTSDSPIDYGRTMVFHSTDPTRFAWDPVTEMLAHAAEVIEVDGQSYITAAGWTATLGERWRGLSIARLGWARR
jgi:beta-fructofuranosidase